MGIWAECIPPGTSDDVYAALRSQGIRCVVGTSDVKSRVDVVCNDGEATVHLRIRPTHVTIVSTSIRASVEQALVVRLVVTTGRTWRQRRLDRKLLSKIEAALAPFTEAEAEIEKAALLAKASTPVEAENALKEWNRKYKKRALTAHRAEEPAVAVDGSASRR